jgi:hypothetical protein
MKQLFYLNEVRTSFCNETTPVPIVLLQELEYWNDLVNSLKIILCRTST